MIRHTLGILVVTLAFPIICDNKYDSPPVVQLPPTTTQPSNPYALARQYAAQHGVRPELIEAMILRESRGNPTARSRKGAVGLLQLMPVVADIYAVTDRTHPEQNIKAGVAYFARLLKRFKSERLALAAYNAGPTAVVKHGGVPPFPETEAYVEWILDRAGAQGESKAPAGRR